MVEPESSAGPNSTEENSSRKKESTQKTTPLKYGPLGPGDRRTNWNPPANHDKKSTIQNLDSEDELNSSSDESKKQSNPQIAYAPLEIDSDVESDLSSVGPRSRKRISSKDYDPSQDERPSSKNSSLKRRFPNPDNYEDPRKGRNIKFKNHNGHQDGFSKTSSFEFSKKGQEAATEQGDFNEVGIPTDTAHVKDVKSLIDRYEQNVSQETLSDDQLSVKSMEDTRSRSESKLGIPLVAMVPTRLSSRKQSSTDSGSLPNVQDKNSERRQTPSPKHSAKEDKPIHQTDL